MRILLVEDNPSIYEFLKKALEQESYAVDIATDGKEGFYLATVNKYDLMILDVMLPYMSGFDLCKQLRDYKIDTSILMLTAKDDSEDIIKGLDSGADDYITKPFVLKELQARIRAILRRNSSNTATLKYKDLQLDTIKKLVYRDEIKIDLTAKEFAILELLVRNENKTVSDSMIIEHVWDMNYTNASNLVKVYIYRLRNKIDKSFDEPYIHNIKNIGYTLK
ncbi:response regulator transcription factor [Arcobacter sp. YIC-464]|uniref:response regulator transcription factor n=1 Tax=Arcobacter sp. YIC-464 TaxID=3376631 RepID=UPI003C14B4B9